MDIFNVKIWCHDQFDVSFCDLSRCYFRPSLAETQGWQVFAACQHTTLPMCPAHWHSAMTNTTAWLPT